MKKATVLTAALLLLLACSPREFTFVQMTDMQIGFFEEDVPGFPATTASFNRAIDEVNALRPELLFFTGDLTHRPENEEQRQVYRDAVARLNGKTALWIVPGNHEMLPYSEETRERYMDFLGYDRFSLIHRGCAFIGIDSNCIKENDWARAEEQWNWLLGELEKAGRCSHKFIFLHCPIVREDMDEKEDYFNFPMEERQKYTDLFAANGVDAVFSGHTHIGYDTTIDGVRYINAGPVGPAFNDRQSGYNVVKVNGKDWSCEYKTFN